MITRERKRQFSKSDCCCENKRERGYDFMREKERQCVYERERKKVQSCGAILILKAPEKDFLLSWTEFWAPRQTFTTEITMKRAI